MKNLTTYFLTALISLVLFSCNKKAENNSIPEKDIPAPLQEKRGISNYKTFRSDLTEELYLELVSNSPELKKFEDDLLSISAKPNEFVDKFDTYNNKSEGYYYSAENKANTIKDSLLRKRIIALISTRKSNYTNKTAELTSLLKQIENNGTTLADNHTILKILLTFPIIEKYQNENLPNKTEFKDVIKQQENFIEQTIKLTPKY